MRRQLLLAATGAGVLALAGCGGHNASAPTAPSTTAQTTTAGPPPARMPLTVYALRGGVLRPHVVQVDRTPAVAGAALRALGIEATVAIANGTATVDLPGASDEQVAEIVYTLTQFPSVQRVDVGGRSGLTRADVSDYAPLILVDSPGADATVPADVHVSGSAAVFEGTLVVELVRDGTVLAQQTVTASAGAPQRGTFSTTLHAPSAGAAVVVAYSPSAEDGSRQHEVDVPVTVAG